MRVVIHTDASVEIGSGHVSRCLALAQALMADGGQVTIAADAMLEHLRERAGQLGVAVVPRDTAPRRPDWVIIDSYHLDENDRRRLAEADVPRLVIDDAGSAAIDADVVLNQNLYASPMGPSRTSTGELVVGPAYALLGRDYASVAPERGQPERADRIVVTMGGTDPHDATTAVTRALASLPPRLDVRVVLGAGHPASDVAAGAASRAGFSIVRSPSTMAEHLAWADIVVSGCGTTVLEAVRLGRPIVGIVVADNQVPVAAAIAAEELGIVAGRHPGLEASRVLDAVEALLDDPARRSAITARGSMLVDGHGAERVAQVMASGALDLRHTTPEDAELLLAWRNDPVSRAASFDTGEIELPSHVAWLRGQIGDPATDLWLGTVAGLPVGVVRFVTDRDVATISVTVAPAHRGRGIGVRLITSGCARLVTERSTTAVEAWIRPGNAASIRAFRAAGFRPDTREASDRLLYRLGPASVP